MLAALSVLAAAALSAAALPSPHLATRAGLPVSLQFAYALEVDVGTPLGPVPIDQGAGYQVATPITGGTAKGPLYNGTLTAGQVQARFYNNGTVGTSTVSFSGQSDQGSGFLGTEYAQVANGTEFSTLSTYYDPPFDYLTYLFTICHTTAETSSVISQSCYIVKGPAFKTA